MLVHRIVPELPLLEAALEGVPDTLFQGEMVEGRLRVTNRGLAPAAHVYAKTAPPSWVFLQDPGGAERRAENGMCMSMVGVSGTVFRVAPAGGSSSSSLAPGQSLSVPVWVRGLGGGKQTLRLLLRYEREGGVPSSSSSSSSSSPQQGSRLLGGSGVEQHEQQYRYTHLSHDVCVLPSVAVAPSVSPSYAMPGECVLSLSVTNYRMDGPEEDRRVELHSVRACSSLAWHFGSVMLFWPRVPLMLFYTSTRR